MSQENARADLHCKLDTTLHTELVRIAAGERRSITSIVTGLIEDYVQNHKTKRRKKSHGG